MDLSWLTFRDLQYLEAAARENHFGRAAEACHVTQPALSMQLAKLERLLGAPLFERTGRRVTVTPAGATAAEIARDLLTHARRFADLSLSTKAPFGGELRLAAIRSLGPYFLPFALPLLRKQFPKLHLSLHEGLTLDLLDDLDAGNVDAVLCADTFEHGDRQIWPLFREPLLLCVAKGHPLAARKPLRTRDLDVRSMVVLKDGHCLRDQALGYCRLGKKHRPSPVTADTLETLRLLVSMGEGYTLIPKLAMRESDPLSKWVQYLPFPGEEVFRDLVLVSRASYPYGGDLRVLAQALKAEPPRGLTMLS